MTKKAVFLAVLVLALSTTVSMKAQGFGGCVDSPENPTLILAGLASGAFAVSSVRNRMRARRASRNLGLRNTGK